jgi:hypothetical protein
MDAQDFLSLQEAYLEVYQQLDEKEDSPYEKASDAALDARYGYGRAQGDKRSFGRAANRSSAASALRAIRRGERSGSGTSTEAGADAVHRGWAKTAKTSTDQTPEKKAKRAQLANTEYKDLPDDEQEKDRVSFNAVRAVYNRNKTKKEEYDIYDIILLHLLDEGYAETPEAAEAIMVNMSEEWREGILDEANRGDEYATRGMSSDDAITAKIRRRNSAGGYNPDEPRRIERSPTGPIGGGTNSRRGQTKRNRGKRTDLVPASDNPSRLERRVGGPKGGTKNPEVVGTNKHLRSQNFKRNPPKRSTSYYDN